MFPNGNRLLNLHQMPTHQLCEVSSRHGGLQDKTAESSSSLRSLPVELRFFRKKASKGRASLMVVAGKKHHLVVAVKKHQVIAKLSSLTLDMAHAMTEVSTVSANVEILKEEVNSVKIKLIELAQAVTDVSTVANVEVLKEEVNLVKVKLTELAQAVTDVSTVSANVEVLKKEVSSVKDKRTELAQAMTNMSTVSTDAEILKKEVNSVKVELTELASIVQMLRATDDRLDNQVSRYLESYEKYNEMNRMPYFYLILLVLVLNLIVEAFLLMKFLEGSLQNIKM